MQLFALDGDKIISCQKASRKKAYLCPECKKKVVVRGGRIKRRHFYHLKAHFCRHIEKSPRHLQIQLRLKSQIPELVIEKYFPSIARVADLAWEEKKIIFEIQSSLIKEELIDAREIDYRSIGYDVVWLLSDHLFNKYLLSPSEIRLGQSIFYFTDKKFFYDQYERILGNKRVFKGQKLLTDLARPIRDPHLHFEGDLKSRKFFDKAPSWGQKIKISYFCLLEMTLLDSIIEKRL